MQHLASPAVARPSRQTLALMDSQYWALFALAAVAVTVYALDRRVYRRAKDVRTSWQCIRCGIQLRPMESTEIRVAGGPEFATAARACQRCAKRNRRIWWGTMGFVALAFLVTIVLLWQQ